MLVVAVFLASGYAEIVNNIVVNNKISSYGWYGASSNGGGICSDSGKIIGNIISNNIVGAYGYMNGSAIASGGGILAFHQITIMDNTVSYNLLSASTYTGNSYEYGSAIYLGEGVSESRHNTIVDTGRYTIYIGTGSPVIDSNNLYSTGYIIYNGSVSNINAPYNYWYATDTSSINAKIWDYYNSSGVGKVFYEPFLTSGDTIAPVPPPLSLTATQTGEGRITLNWDTVKVSDVAGYKVWYDTDTSGYPYTGTGANEGNSPIEVGNITTFELTGLSAPIYYVAVTAYDNSGDSSWYSNEAVVQLLGVEEESPKPKFQNAKLEVYPNPSFSKPVIKYELPEKVFVSLNLYDLSGRLVKPIYSGTQDKGYYTVELKSNELTKGIYFIKFKGDTFTSTKKLVILK